MTAISTVQDVWEITNNSNITILYFKMENCGVCESVLYRMQEELPEKHLKNMHIIQSEQAQEVTGQYSIFTAPTILFFHEGKEIHRESRFIDFQKIDRLLSIFDNQDNQ